jgi:exodeoxyribonuclease VII small subunit
MAEKHESFERKLERAKTILEQLSDPELSLEEGMKRYQEGIVILKEAGLLIEEAKLTYAKLQEKENEA